MLELDSARKALSGFKIFNAGLIGFSAFCLERAISTGECDLITSVATLILSATAFVTSAKWEKEAKTNYKKIATSFAIHDELSKSNNDESEMTK